MLLCPDLHVLTEPGALRTLFVEVAMEALLLGSIDEIIGHWLLIQPPAPLSSLEVRGWD